jgi:hypothetical protein
MQYFVINIILIHKSCRHNLKKSYRIVYQAQFFGFHEPPWCRPTCGFVSHPATVNITVSVVILEDCWEGGTKEVAGPLATLGSGQLWYITASGTALAGHCRPDLCNAAALGDSREHVSRYLVWVPQERMKSARKIRIVATYRLCKRTNITLLKQRKNYKNETWQTWTALRTEQEEACIIEIYVQNKATTYN